MMPDTPDEAFAAIKKLAASFVVVVVTMGIGALAMHWCET
jgi:hypothetical protein